MVYRSTDQRAVTPQHRGRYPGFDVLDSVEVWDDVTAGVVLGRLALPGEFAFFTPTEISIAGPLLDRLLAQDTDPRVPVLGLIDARLAAGETDGWHYDEMPEDAQAWRDTLRFLEEDAQQRHHGRGFAHLISDEQAVLVQAVQDLNSDDASWHGWSAAHVWSLWTRYACTAFYSHPWAWNEIGFPGPAYPRGYLNPGVNSREHWERPDSGTEDSDTDPVTFAGRVELARREHQRILGLEGSGVKSDYGAIRARNDSAWLIPNDGARTNHQLRADMRRYADGDEVDLLVVGAGAGGGVLTQRLARAGWRVVCLDAGPFWDPDTDWVSDERGAHTLYWTEPRQIGGTSPVPLGSNNSGRGVGGSMVHYAGYTPRFHPSDFHTATADGVGADWPIDYTDLKPFYELIEQELPVAGQDWPWGDPHTYPHHAHPVGGNGDIFLRGAHAAGIDARVGPVAIPNGRFGNRPHCIYRGFCLQGCKVNAKASPLITHIPDALANGAEIRSDSMVTRVVVDDRTGAVTGVNYVNAGVEHYQRARAVAICGYSIETPRLLLLSATERYRQGLGNEHDQLGRYLMVQGAPQTAGRFEDEIRMYKAPPPEVSSEQFYETDPTKPYKRGWSIQTVSPLPITWAEHVTAQGHWGAPLREYMRDYVHWATLGALCEYLPQADNRVTLADETDRHGLPVAHFAYSQCDNDKQLTQAATASMESILKAAGASEVMTIDRYAHLVGGARMAARAEDGVVDANHRVFGVPNLYVVDGSTLPTQGSANPALTIMALAARAADRLISRGRHGLTEQQTEAS